MTQTNDVKFWQKIVAILLAVFVVLSTVAVVLFVNYNKLNKDSEDKKDTTQTQNIKPDQNDQGIVPNNNKPSQKDTVTFGWYPQKMIKNKNELTTLNKQPVEKWDTLAEHEYLECADIYYGEKKYRAIRLKETDGYLTSYQYDKNKFTQGETYWFEYQPLEWKMLDEETGLAICTTIINCQKSNNIYQLLNVNFYNIAFEKASKADTSKIETQKIGNDEFNVILLDVKDFDKYQITAGTASDCKYSDYAYYMGDIPKNQNTTSWWVRNERPGNFVDTNHLSAANPSTFAGVRPVIYFKADTK